MLFAQAQDLSQLLGVSAQLIFGVLLLFGGAFGGFLAGIKTRKENLLEMPFNLSPLKLGFVGDVLLGVAAAIVAIVFYNILPSNTPEQKTIMLRDFCAYIGFGIAAGFTGIKILDKASGDFVALERRMDRKVQVNELLSEGRYLLATNKYAQAVDRFKEALNIDPASLAAKFGYATARNFADPHDHKEPVALLTEVINADPKYPNAHYNRSCCMALNKESYNSDLIATDLKEAFRLDRTLKKYVATDEDFEGLRNEEWFQQLFT